MKSLAGIMNAMPLDDLSLIHKIAERAALLFGEYEIDQQGLEMDLIVAHADTPLQLSELLAAADDGTHRQDFTHDIGGIKAHTNRQTCVIDDCFCPRYAVQ